MLIWRTCPLSCERLALIVHAVEVKQVQAVPVDPKAVENMSKMLNLMPVNVADHLREEKTIRSDQGRFMKGRERGEAPEGRETR